MLNLFFYSLFFDIFWQGSRFHGADLVHEVILPSKPSVPELLSDIGTRLKNFWGYDALYHSDHLLYAVRGNDFNQIMTTVPVGFDLQKQSLVAFSSSAFPSQPYG